MNRALPLAKAALGLAAALAVVIFLAPFVDPGTGSLTALRALDGVLLVAAGILGAGHLVASAGQEPAPVAADPPRYDVDLFDADR